ASSGAGVAQPPAQPDIEEGQQERNRRRRVVAHVGAGRRAGNRQGSSDRDGFMELSVGSILALGAIPQVPASAEQRGGCERLCFPLLPGQILSPDKIDGDVQNMERLSGWRKGP